MSVLSLSDEFVTVFLDASNPFRETVTYTATGSAAKDIFAIVNRGGAAKTSRGHGAEKLGSIYDYELIISCDATQGIQYVTPMKDKVSIVAPEFAESNTFSVAGVISKTAMCWHLGLRP